MPVIKKSRLGVSVEVNTPLVPNDGRFHVVVDEEVVYSTSVETAALVSYEEIVAERDAPFARLREQDRREGDYFAARRESVARITSSTPKGGRGGRGGV